MPDNNGIQYTNPPQSRNEAIIEATIEGTEYTNPPQSRMEALLLELKEVIEGGGGGGGMIAEERDITTRKLNVNEDIELTDISSTGDVFLYANENLAYMADKAETTSKDVTYKIQNGLVYIDGIATGSLHIYPTIELPSWTKGCALMCFCEVVSGTKTGTITFKAPYTYRNSSNEEKQASMNLNATAKAVVTTMNVNTVTCEFSVPTGAGGSSLVIKPYIAVLNATKKSMSYPMPVASRAAVTASLKDASGILIGMTADFSAHVKSKTQLPKLFGKRLVMCGDSVAYGAQGDAFSMTISENENMSYENHSESGATLSTYTPQKYIAGQVQNLTSEYDYILIDGGYNDRAHSVALGSLTSGFSDAWDESTVLGALEKMFSFLNTNYPNTKKLFVLIHQVANTSYVPDSGQTTYFTAIKTALEKWHIPYIDLREYPLCAFNAEAVAAYFNSTDFASNGGVHPNTNGYAYGYVDQVTAKMESI